MLPQKNGFDVCRDLRKAGNVTPLLMLTARGQVIDRVLGLKIGADDYLTKPFEMMELMARVEALLRRAPILQTEHNIHEFGPLRIDLRGTSVSRDGRIIPLSAREFQLLRYFVEHRGTTLSRDVLLKEVWGYDSDAGDSTADYGGHGFAKPSVLVRWFRMASSVYRASRRMKPGSHFE